MGGRGVWATFTPAECDAIDGEGDDVALPGNDRLHAHAHETCDWRWNCERRITQPFRTSRRVAQGMGAAHEKGSVFVDKIGTVTTASGACGDELVLEVPPEYRAKEECLRPVGAIVWDSGRRFGAPSLAISWRNACSMRDGGPWKSRLSWSQRESSSGSICMSTLTRSSVGSVANDIRAEVTQKCFGGALIIIASWRACNGELKQIDVPIC